MSELADLKARRGTGTSYDQLCNESRIAAALQAEVARLTLVKDALEVMRDAHWYLDEYYELASCPGAKTTLERLESLITNAARSGKDTP